MLDMLLGGMSQAGALGGALIGLKGQNDTNNMNQEMMRETNAFNSAEAAQARAFGYNVNKQNQEYATQMSNTAYQRSTADMRAAGINPMVAFSQGGASTPTTGSVPSGQASAGAPARLESGMGRLGEALGRIGPDALSLMSGLKDLQNKEATNGAIKAGAVASAAQADNFSASAAATRAGMGDIEARSRSASSRSEADIAESTTRKQATEYERNFVKSDAITNRFLQMLGGVTDSLNIKNLLMGGRHSERNQTMKEERHLRQQGRSGTGLK